MNLSYNLPPEQRWIQKLVAQFNADEQFWRSLERKRMLRRKRHPRVSARCHEVLDLLEFARTRPARDCIGEEIQP
jgi:hypothetical protein